MSTLIPIRTLIVEDCEDDALLLVNVIKKGGFDPEFTRVDSKHDLTDVLQARKWDIVFSDFTMPNFDGHEALQLVRLHDPDVPFFFVSGTIGEDRAVEAMRMGAQDYFIKGNLRRLPSAIGRELSDSVQRREHRAAQERIQYLANYDALTGLPNRTQFVEYLTSALAMAALTDTSVGVFALNLSRLKDINDHLGAAAGDAVLIEFARRLSAITQNFDIAARLSADEFAVVATNLKAADDIAKTADVILSTLTQPFALSRYEWRIHARVGASLFPNDGDSGDELFGNAMLALHYAQRNAGGSFVAYEKQMRAQVQEKVTLQHALEQALEQREFTLHYQPQVALCDGRIVGVEALLRWPRPGREPISPAKFIPMAEQSGLIIPMGEWTLRQACQQIKRWCDQGIPVLRTAVNFSAYQFRQRNIANIIETTLEEFGISPASLEVELTETALMQDPNVTLAILSDLHEMGVSIALDDFGTGYSSLSYLKRFPVDILKIDRAFICDLPADKDDIVIVRAIIAMADKMNMKVIAEGVETAEQLEFLKSVGCDMVQGYYFKRPASPAELYTILEAGRFDV